MSSWFTAAQLCAANCPIDSSHSWVAAALSASAHVFFEATLPLPVLMHKSLFSCVPWVFSPVLEFGLTRHLISLPSLLAQNDTRSAPPFWGNGVNPSGKCPCSCFTTAVASSDTFCSVVLSAAGVGVVSERICLSHLSRYVFRIFSIMCGGYLCNLPASYSCSIC